MEFSTLEIIGLAFMAGLKINELTEEVINEDEEKEKSEKTENNEEEKVVVGKLEGKDAEKFMNMIEKVIKEEK